MMVADSQQETLDPGFALFGTSQQGVPVIFRKLTLPDDLDPVSSSFTVRSVTTGLYGSRLTSCRTDFNSQMVDHCVLISVMCVKFFLV
ncbi:unnamed protein product [Schistosoma mattheei]|uniref:Uncharacterized protein n=1 Tax=Schistosoma mattheei TaxID=31246 RepID=A0A183NDR5_9TREM|nr:unnamed protein product [Schistosoma mattheei]